MKLTGGFGVCLENERKAQQQVKMIYIYTGQENTRLCSFISFLRNMEGFKNPGRKSCSRSLLLAELDRALFNKALSPLHDRKLESFTTE